MREIVFKAKRIDTGEWVEGYYQEHPEGYTHIQNSMMDCFPVHHNTICQYTGHEDDNGKKIFENDLLECKEFSNGQLIKHFLSQVEWDDDGTGFTFKDSKYSWAFMDSLTVYECEVVGNIFDNPEQEKENEYE